MIDAFKEVLKEIPETVLILSSGIANTKTDSGQYDGYDLDRFVSEAGLIDYVLLPRTVNKGPIDDTALNIQYNLADINVTPSVGEGFSLSTIESGLCGVPTIATDCSALHETVKNRGVLVEPKAYTYNLDGSRYWLLNYMDLKKAIVDLLKDDKKRQEYGKEAQIFASKLTPESRAKLMLDRFELLIKQDAQPVARR